MLHYGGPSPKKHYALSNSSEIRHLHVGGLVGWKKLKKSMQEKGQHVDLVHRYKDKKGKTCYKGSKQLRSSEPRG